LGPDVVLVKGGGATGGLTGEDSRLKGGGGGGGSMEETKKKLLDKYAEVGACTSVSVRPRKERADGSYLDLVIWKLESDKRPDAHIHL